MKLLKFDSESINALLGIGEAGMDVSIVMGRCDDIPEDVHVAIRGNGFAIPFNAQYGRIFITVYSYSAEWVSRIPWRSSTAWYDHPHSSD